MILTHRRKRGLSLLILCALMPAYIALAVTIIGWSERLPFILELIVYAALGILWVFPFRSVFRGIGRDAENTQRD